MFKNCSNLALVFWCRIMCLFSLWCKVFGKIKVKLCLLVGRLIGGLRCAEKGVTAKIDRQKIGGQREKDHQGYKVCADDGILRHRWNLSPTPKHQGMAMPWNLLQKTHTSVVELEISMNQAKSSPPVTLRANHNCPRWPPLPPNARVDANYAGACKRIRRCQHDHRQSSRRG